MNKIYFSANVLDGFVSKATAVFTGITPSTAKRTIPGIKKL
jgi:hypothetical protein